MKDLVQNSTAALPHQADATFLMDAGIETTLIFHDRLDLPHFAAFTLLESAEGTAVLRRYYQRHLDIALAGGLGFVLESATWRASSDWGALLGYDAAALRRINLRAVALLHEIRAAAGNLLEDLSVFDEYRGKELGDRRSVAWSLSFRASDRTLRDEEVDKAIARVLKRLEERLDVHQRR